jgi:hypothetical protein
VIEGQDPAINPAKMCPTAGGPCEHHCVGDDCIMVAFSSQRKGELETPAAA